MTHDEAFTTRSEAQWARFEAIQKVALAYADRPDGAAFKASIKDRWMDAFRAFLNARQRAVLFLAAHEIKRELTACDTALDAMDALVREGGGQS